jgi:hypothetical protein
MHRKMGNHIPLKTEQPFNKPVASTLNSMTIALQNNFTSAIKHSGMDLG